jgi:hypothetical protein
LKSNGKVIAWGDNTNEELAVPEPNTDFIAISAGDAHCLGLKANGTIIAWGDSYYGQDNVPEPNTDFIAISDGWEFCLGLKANGSIVAWGNNSHGECNVPTPNTNFVAIAAGHYFGLGLKANGSIVAWGDNSYGQCWIPCPNTNFIAVSAGEGFCLGLKRDGSIVAWGDNSHGQCNVPKPNTNYIAISAGGEHSLGIRFNSPPVAFFTYAISEFSATFDASLSYDPDGNISSWCWDFGDGVQSSGEIVPHTYQHSGVYNVTLTVRDNSGDEASITRSVTVIKYQIAFIFGRIANKTMTGGNIMFEAVHLSVITFIPFSWIRYSSGEQFTISREHWGFVGSRFIFTGCNMIL